jgi:hypothetical protein
MLRASCRVLILGEKQIYCVRAACATMRAVLVLLFRICRGNVEAVKCLIESVNQNQLPQCLKWSALEKSAPNSLRVD